MKTHPVAALFPILSEPELKRLADDIAANGLQHPIVMEGDVLLDGRNRLAACKLAGVEPSTIQYVGQDAAAFIVSANLHRRHLNTSQRALIAAKIANLPDGVTKRSAKLPTPVTQPDAAKMLNVSERSVRSAKVLLDLAPEVAEKVRSGELTVAAGLKKARPHVSRATGKHEWYSPKSFVETGRSVLGTIDLDPASSKAANKVVQAEKFYTAEDDGLKHDWAGKVWMNPPYGTTLIGPFIDKLKESVEAGTVKEAIVLTNNATDTKWFAVLASISSVLCFPTGRVKYTRPEGESGTPLQGQCLSYIGSHDAKFIREFRAHGILCRVEK